MLTLSTTPSVDSMGLVQGLSWLPMPSAYPSIVAHYFWPRLGVRHCPTDGDGASHPALPDGEADSHHPENVRVAAADKGHPEEIRQRPAADVH